MSTLRVFKYPFPIGQHDDQFEVELSVGARILHVDQQGNTPMLWALVDPTNDLVARRFRVCGTGHPLNYPLDHLTHVGTWSVGQFVWHLFEIP